MNFLAHQHLSFPDESLMIGNFVADFIRGGNLSAFPESVQRGIFLHREIDRYTDTHPVVRENVHLLSTYFGKYGAVLSDVWMDHFLSKKWDSFHDIPLSEFTASFYKLINRNFEMIPLRARRILPYMQYENWLLNYAHFDGMQKAMRGLGRRASFENSFEKEGVEILKKHYSDFEANFDQFYPDLVEHVSIWILESGLG